MSQPRLETGCKSHDEIYVCRQHGQEECEHSNEEKFGPYSRCEGCSKLQVWHSMKCEFCGHQKKCQNCLSNIKEYGSSKFRIGLKSF
jgi:hypothetical protein